MIEITAEIRALIDKAAACVELAGDEYIDPADGLIHCKKCGGQRQTVVPFFFWWGYLINITIYIVLFLYIIIKFYYFIKTQNPRIFFKFRNNLKFIY